MEGTIFWPNVLLTMRIIWLSFDRNLIYWRHCRSFSKVNKSNSFMSEPSLARMHIMNSNDLLIDFLNFIFWKVHYELDNQQSKQFARSFANIQKTQHTQKYIEWLFFIYIVYKQLILFLYDFENIFWMLEKFLFMACYRRKHFFLL